MTPAPEQIPPSTQPQDPLEEQTVKLWRKRIKDAKTFFEQDFKRMRENMEFAANIQWQGQQNMDSPDKYVANFITHHVSQKVSSLYARDPKAVAQRRKRMDYQVWDGSVEQLMQARMVIQQAMMTGIVTPDAAQAQVLLQDFAQGQQWEKLCEKVGKTLEIVYGYQCDTQSPSFKFQMKQLVRRVITCGVGYVRINYVNNFDHVLSSTLTDDSLAGRVKKAKGILQGISDDRIQSDDPRMEQLSMLFASVQSSQQNGDMTNIEERIEFDFPSATSIIVDPRCRSLKGFIGAEWVAQQYIMPLDAANSYFELSGENMVTTGGQFVQYADDTSEMPRPSQDAKPEDPAKVPLGCFWEVFDLTTKSSFFICDGWQWYVQAPKPLEPSINRFWPIFGLTFNDIECEPGQKVHVYPPSDVQLLKPMQLERNRSRQEMIDHRKANRPFFWALAGTVEEDDQDKLANHETGELLILKSAPMGNNGTQNVVDAIGKWQGVPIDGNLYTTLPINEDVNLVVGSNQIQQQQPIRHVAATPAVIQEQARISDVNSNVDDLDDLLTEMAKASGEIILRVFSPQTVQRIAGRGAVFPQDNKQDFLNEIDLQIVAASSGRPNKAIEVANFERVAPLLLQAGANPWGVIKEAIKRLDDKLEPSDFAPTMMPTGTPAAKPSSGAPQQQQGQTGQPQQHMAQAGGAVPLPGHNQ